LFSLTFDGSAFELCRRRNSNTEPRASEMSRSLLNLRTE
jgi:hypothetical protein